MEALFVHLMLWGQQRGLPLVLARHGAALGLRALAGGAALDRRSARFVYEHGEAFYNFQGLRAFKEKFDPVWEPRYLAYPGGLALPRVLADVSALIAGGYRRIFVKSAGPPAGADPAGARFSDAASGITASPRSP